MTKAGNHIGAKLVGSRKTRKFHIPNCQWAESIIVSDNLVWFENKDEAFAAEYVPCRDCHPERGF